MNHVELVNKLCLFPSTETFGFFSQICLKLRKLKIKLFLKVEHFLAENSFPPPDTTSYCLPPLSANFSNQYIFANIWNLLIYKLSKLKK